MSRVTAKAALTEYAERNGSLSQVAEFCHVKHAAVVSWLEDDTWPRGEQLYRLWAFLEFGGFTLSELEHLPKPTHQLLLIVAAGELSFTDVQKELNYQNLQDVYRLFRQATDPTRDRALKLEALVRQHEGVLDRYRNQFGSTASARSAPLATEWDEVPVASPTRTERTNTARSVPETKEQSSLARLLRLTVKRSNDLEPDELKRQLQEVPREELETFALLLLELV